MGPCWAAAEVERNAPTGLAPEHGGRRHCHNLEHEDAGMMLNLEVL